MDRIFFTTNKTKQNFKRENYENKLNYYLKKIKQLNKEYKNSECEEFVYCMMKKYKYEYKLNLLNIN